MTNEQQVANLLRRAAADVPAEFMFAPYRAIRRRYRRRKALTWMASTVAVVVVGVGAAALMVARPSSVHPTPGDRPPSATSTSPQGAVPTVAGLRWTVARVDRTGRSITVYTASPEDRCAHPNQAKHRATIVGGVVSLHVDGVLGECPADQPSLAAEVRFDLDEPLGDRQVVDAAAPAGQPLVVRDRDLPDPEAAGLTPVPTMYLNLRGTRFGISWTRPGGPDVYITAYPATLDPGQPKQVGTLDVGGRPVTVHEFNNGWLARWRSADGRVILHLTLSPAEGKTLQRTEFEANVRGLPWP